MRSGMNNQQYNYNNSMGCNNPITSNNNASAQSNITRSTIRRMSPTMCTQHNNSVASSTSSIPASSSTTTSTLENVIPVQGITNSIMSGSGGGKLKCRFYKTFNWQMALFLIRKTLPSGDHLQGSKIKPQSFCQLSL